MSRARQAGWVLGGVISIAVTACSSASAPGAAPGTTQTSFDRNGFLAAANAICAKTERLRPAMPTSTGDQTYRSYLTQTAKVIGDSNQEILALRFPPGAEGLSARHLFGGGTDIDPKDFSAALQELDAASRSHDAQRYARARARITDLAARGSERARSMGTLGLTTCERAYDVEVPQ